MKCLCENQNNNECVRSKSVKSVLLLSSNHIVSSNLSNIILFLVEF